MHTAASRLSFFIAIAVGILGYNLNSIAAENNPLPVLTTVGMIGDIAQQVAGDCAEVQTLMPPGTDPHYYEATPRAIRAIDRAELIFYVDTTLEERLGGILENFSRRTPTVGLAQATYDSADLLLEASDTLDPHIWMDANRWGRIAPVIAEAIAEQRPGCADTMMANAITYQKQLTALHDWIKQSISSIPKTQRMLVTAHDAFYYYAKAYAITASEAIEGISTESEASIGDIRAVARFVVDNAIPAVFVESTISPRTIEALVTEVTSMGHDVRIGGTLFSDSLGELNTAEGTYIGMLRANTLQVTNALGGTPAPWPAELTEWATRWSK